MKLFLPLSEIWVNSQTTLRFKLKYFHRHIYFERDYDFDYRLWEFAFGWRFSLWIGWRVFHIATRILIRIPKWRKK